MIERMRWIPGVLLALAACDRTPPPTPPPAGPATATSAGLPPPPPTSVAPPAVDTLLPKWAAFRHETRDLPWAEMARRWMDLREATRIATASAPPSAELEERMEATFGIVSLARMQNHERPPMVDACATCWGTGLEAWCGDCAGTGKRLEGDRACGVCPYKGEGACPRCAGRGAGAWGRGDPCLSCAARGARIADGIRPCTTCRGRGLKEGARSSPSEPPCVFCRSAGKTTCVVCGSWSPKSCAQCDGSGRKEEEIDRACACRRVPKTSCARCRGMSGWCACVPAPDPACGRCAGRGIERVRASLACGECLLRKLGPKREPCGWCGAMRVRGCVACGGSGRAATAVEYEAELDKTVRGFVLRLKNGAFVSLAGCDPIVEHASAVDAEVRRLTSRGFRVEPAGPASIEILPAHVFIRDGPEEIWLNARLIARGWATPAATPDGVYEEALRKARK
jgi:hypothetical protein